MKLGVDYPVFMAFAWLASETRAESSEGLNNLGLPDPLSLCSLVLGLRPSQITVAHRKQKLACCCALGQTTELPGLKGGEAAFLSASAALCDRSWGRPGTAVSWPCHHLDASPTCLEMSLIVVPLYT